jgi:hypothetical protein
MAEPRVLVVPVAELGFATKMPKEDEDMGKGLRVKIVVDVDLMQPVEIEQLAAMQSEGRVKMTLLQEQLPMFGKGGETA